MSAPSSPACGHRPAPSPGLELLQGGEQQQQPCTEPSTPSAAPADLAHALYWQSLQQQQQQLEQDQTHHVTSSSPRNQLPAQALQGQRPSIQSLQPALQLLGSSEDAAASSAASSAGQLTAAVQDRAEGNPVSPFSPSSADLLQQLDELHKQVAVLTRHVRADSDARSEGGQLAGLGPAQTSAKRLALRSAHQSNSQGAPAASSQHSPVAAGPSTHPPDSIQFNRVGSSSSLASSSFGSRGSSARPAQAASTRDATARPSAGSRLSTGWPAQSTGDSEAHDMPDSIPDLPPDSHDNDSRFGVMRWQQQPQQLAHRLLAEGAQEQSHAGLQPVSLRRPASQHTPQQANSTVGDAVSHGVVQPAEALHGALGGLQGAVRPADAAWADTLTEAQALVEARLAPVLAALRQTTDVLAQANAPMQQSDQQALFDGSQMPGVLLGAAGPAAIYREPTLYPSATAPAGPAAYQQQQQQQQAQARPSAEAQHSFGMIPQASPPVPGAIMQAVQAATQPAYTASAGLGVYSAQAPGSNFAASHAGVQLQASTAGLTSAAEGFPPLGPSVSHLPAAPSMAGLQHPGFWPAAAAAASTGAGMPGMPGMPFSPLGQFPGALLAEQQVEYLLRLQQVQMLQQHMQAAAAQGGLHGPGLQVAALQGQPAAVWGMPAYPHLLQPAVQQQAAGAQAGAAGIAAPQPAGVAAAAGNGPPAPPQYPPVDFGSPAAARSSSTSAPAAQALSPFAAAASRSSTGDEAWITRWVPLSRRSTSHDASAQAPQPYAASLAEEQTAAAAGDMTWAVQASASPPAAPSTMMQLVLYPVTRPLAAAAAGGSLMLQALWCAGGTAASASAWSAHSAAMACVRLSQYQLLVLLCSLTAMAAAAQAAGCAAAAAADTSRTLLQLADRETRLFARAAAVVAYTDMKKLCRQLATQPLLLMQGAVPAQAALQGDQVSATAARDAVLAVSTQSRRSSIDTPSAAEGTGRSLSRGLSGLLGGLFGSAAGQHSKSHLGSTRSTPRPSFNASRRCSATGGPLQLDGYPATAGSGSTACSRFSSQELTFGTDSGHGGGALAAGHAGFRSRAAAASGGVPGVSAATLVLYDSLAVVSGLWAGMWFRLWLLLMLQGPLASARIWLQAVRTACMVSVAATLATTRTSMQAAWTLSHLSLAVLGSAAAKSAAGEATAQHFEASKASAGSAGASKMLSSFAGIFSAAVIAALQWIGLQAARPWGSALQYLGAAVTAAVPGSGAMGQRLSRWYATAASAVSVLAAATSETLLWLGTVKQDAGLFSKSGLKAVASKGLQLAGFVVTWVLSMMLALAERLAVPVVEYVLRDVSPVGRAAVYGSARMVKGLFVEASKQSGLLAGQLFEAWRVHD